MALNSLNINSQGVVYFNGVAQFSGVDGSTLGKVLTSNGPGVAPSFQPVPASSLTLTGDSGTATGSSLTVHANHTANNCGASVLFTNSGTTSTLNVSDFNFNTFVGNLAGNNSVFGGDNTGFGQNSLNSLTTGSNNTGIGEFTLQNLLTGIYNVALGSVSGNAYTGNESSNILISNNGVISDANTMRLGTQGSFSNNINKTFIAGIASVAVANTQMVTIDTSTGQLGSAIAIALNYTNVNFAASPYTVLATDQYISVDTSGGAVSILFPNAPTAGRRWVVKDRTGTSSASNITITTVGGTVTIDSAATLVINSNYGSVQLLSNATPTYEVY